MYSDKKELLEDMKNGFFSGNAKTIEQQISEELLNDDEVIFELIKNNQQLVNTFGDRLMQKPELMKKIFNDIDSTLYHRLSNNYKNNEKFMLQLLEYDMNAPYNLGDDLKKNIDFMRKAGEINKEALNFADKSIKEELQEEVNLLNSLDEKMKKMLGEEKYKLISNYPGTQKIIEEIAKNKNFPALEACVTELNKKDLDTTEWVRGFEKITDNIQNQEYKELLTNIDVKEIDTKKLFDIMQNPNYYNIKNQEQLEKYEETKEEVCNAIVNDDKKKVQEYPKIAKMQETEQVQFAILQQQYGIDVNDARLLWNKCSDINEINNEKSQDVKSYINSVIDVLKNKSIEVLKNIYRTGTTISKNNETLSILNNAKKAYAKEFNNTLINPKNMVEMSNPQSIGINNINEARVLDAGTEFNMIITSIGAYGDGSYQESNYYKNWNREITKAQGVSCSYIGNDMRATASIPEFCFGFSKMAEDSLLMQGSQNLGSTTEQEKLTIKTSDRYNENYTPEDLKDHTVNYNEMVYNRIQNGERKQPDYIVLFKNRNRIEGNINSAMQAMQDFKKEGIDLPIVVVDIDKCKEAEKEKLDEMINEYQISKDNDLKKQIESKIRRNQKTNNQEFAIYYNDLYRAEAYQGITINDYKKSYELTSAEERKEETHLIMQMSRQREKNQNEMML